VVSIENYAFNRCFGLTSISIPSSVTSIGERVFNGCSGITNITFDDGGDELTLGDNAFYYTTPTNVYFGRQMDFTAVPCTALESVEFGENVTSIADGAFFDATSLRTVTSHNAVPPTIGETTFAEDTYSKGTLYVPATSVDMYKGAVGWKCFYDVVGLEVSGIANVSNDAASKVSVDGGAICVDGDADVRVVSMSGTTVYSGRGETRINVTPGIYVVVINNTATKVAVK
jgi:hypothetical protein